MTSRSPVAQLRRLVWWKIVRHVVSECVRRRPENQGGNARHEDGGPREHSTREERMGWIDQDGFLQPVRASGKHLMPGRARYLPRNRNRLEVIQCGNQLVLRKHFGIVPPWRGGFKTWFWGLLGLSFWTEAEAMLRLDGLAVVPRLVKINVLRRTITREYIVGMSLRHRAALRGVPVHDVDVAKDPVLKNLNDAQRTRREAELLAPILDDRLKAKIFEGAASLLERGVALGDVHLANVVVSEASGCPYWIDFELVTFDFDPSWRRACELYTRALRAMFPVRTGHMA